MIITNYKEIYEKLMNKKDKKDKNGKNGILENYFELITEEGLKNMYTDSNSKSKSNSNTKINKFATIPEQNIKDTIREDFNTFSKFSNNSKMLGTLSDKEQLESFSLLAMAMLMSNRLAKQCLHHYNKKIPNEIDKLNRNISVLKTHINHYRKELGRTNDPFYKEKLDREQDKIKKIEQQINSYHNEISKYENIEKNQYLNKRTFMEDLIASLYVFDKTADAKYANTIFYGLMRDENGDDCFMIDVPRKRSNLCTYWAPNL